MCPPRLTERRGVPASRRHLEQACPRTGFPRPSETRTDKCRTRSVAAPRHRGPARGRGRSRHVRIGRRACCHPVTSPAACPRGRPRNLHGITATDGLHPDVEVTGFVRGVRDETSVGRPRQSVCRPGPKVSRVSVRWTGAVLGGPSLPMGRLRITHHVPPTIAVRPPATSAAATLCLARR